MLIKTDTDIPYVHCKSCGSSFRMGGSCRCKSVRTKEIQGGAFIIEEDNNNAVIDTE